MSFSLPALAPSPLPAGEVQMGLGALTREKGCAIIVSRDVVERLPAARRAECAALGSVRLKGKQREVEVFGVG